MAKARIRPENIQITSKFAASPKICSVLSGQQIIFANKSKASIEIEFSKSKAAASFANVSSLKPGHARKLSPKPGRGKVSYRIRVGSKTYGPYAIQITLRVIVGVFMRGSTVCVKPSTAVIRPYGWLEMDSIDGNSYDVTWPSSAGDPFLGLRKVDGVAHQEKIGRVRNYPFEVIQARTAHIVVTSGGGGTVKVKSS